MAVTQNIMLLLFILFLGLIILKTNFVETVGCPLRTLSSLTIRMDSVEAFASSLHSQRLVGIWSKKPQIDDTVKSIGIVCNFVLLNLLCRKLQSLLLWTFSIYSDILASSQLAEIVPHVILVLFVYLALFRLDKYRIVFNWFVNTLNFKCSGPFFDRLCTWAPRCFFETGRWINTFIDFFAIDVMRIFVNKLSSRPTKILYSFSR